MKIYIDFHGTFDQLKLGVGVALGVELERLLGEPAVLWSSQPGWKRLGHGGDDAMDVKTVEKDLSLCEAGDLVLDDDAMIRSLVARTGCSVGGPELLILLARLKGLML